MREIGASHGRTADRREMVIPKALHIPESYPKPVVDIGAGESRLGGFQKEDEVS